MTVSDVDYKAPTVDLTYNIQMIRSPLKDFWKQVGNAFFV